VATGNWRETVLDHGEESFVTALRAELRGGYRPSPVRRVLIPKAGQAGKHRPLGIPTAKDRVEQAAMKNILEPIFEADFFPCSYGFRRGKSAHGALEHLRVLLRPTARRVGRKVERRLPYPPSPTTMPTTGSHGTAGSSPMTRASRWVLASAIAGSALAVGTVLHTITLCVVTAVLGFCKTFWPCPRTSVSSWRRRSSQASMGRAMPTGSPRGWRNWVAGWKRRARAENRLRDGPTFAVGS
jgi:hypothetical protein